MLVAQGGNGLQLDDDFSEADEIRPEDLTERHAFVRELQFGLRSERDALPAELDLEASWYTDSRNPQPLSL
jgi:hypothetical protein